MLLNFEIIIVNNCIYPPHLVFPGLPQMGYLQEFDSYITMMPAAQTGWSHTNSTPKRPGKVRKGDGGEIKPHSTSNDVEMAERGTAPLRDNMLLYYYQNTIW